MIPAFTIGTCRVGYGSCPLGNTMGPRLQTYVHSAPEILWWLDVLQKRISRPPKEFHHYWGRDIIPETFEYDLATPRVFIIEISSLKTVWMELSDGYRFPVQLTNLVRPHPEIQHCLPKQTANSLLVSIDMLHQRIRYFSRLVLVSQELCAPPILARTYIRDTLAQYASSYHDVVHVDSTLIVEQYGREACIRDSIHWTPFGLEKLNQAIINACDGK